MKFTEELFAVFPYIVPKLPVEYNDYNLIMN